MRRIPLLFLFTTIFLTACQSQDTPISPQQSQGPMVEDVVQLGNLTYKVNSVSKLKVIKTLFQIEVQPTNGTFVVVSLTINNHSSEELLIKKDMFRLVDEKGNVTEPETGLDHWLNRKRGGLYNRIVDPLSTKSATLVFDAPDLATASYRLQAKGTLPNQMVHIRLSK